MKTYAHLVQKLFCSPLLVLPTTYSTFERALLQRIGMPFAGEASDPFARRGAQFHSRRVTMNDKTVEETESGPVLETPAQQRQRRVARVLVVYGDVAVISIAGVIDKRLSDFELECYGGCDLADVDAAIAQVAADPKISRVVFDFHSPGGSAAGVPETAARIRALGDYKNKGGAGKETHARVEILCASAAQWLASQCDVVTACPSATLGSVGVYCALLDQSGWLEKEGLKVNLIKAGKFKAMGASFKALEDGERAMLQDRVNALWAQFKEEVCSMRDVPADAMEGQTFTAADAKKRCLCDNINPATLDEYVSALL
jgi:protease-4